MDYKLKTLKDAARAIGRGVVMRADQWKGTTDLALEHLGDTEGDIRINFNESFVSLTTPELTGNAKHKSYVEGEDPTVELPLYLADPALRAIISPAGGASGGFSRRRPVKEHTLVIFPEELFYNEATGLYTRVLSYTSALGVDSWKLDGAALTAEQTRLLGQSIWLWRGYFTKAPMAFRHSDAGKAVDTCTFQLMHDGTKPEGHMLYTIGDPSADTGANLDLEPVTTA